MMVYPSTLTTACSALLEGLLPIGSAASSTVMAACSPGAGACSSVTVTSVVAVSPSASVISNVMVSLVTEEGMSGFASNV